MTDSPSPPFTSSSSYPASLSNNDHYDIIITPEAQARRIIHLRLSEDVVKQLEDQADSVELSFDFNPAHHKYVSDPHVTRMMWI